MKESSKSKKSSSVQTQSSGNKPNHVKQISVGKHNTTNTLAQVKDNNPKIVPSKKPLEPVKRNISQVESDSDEYEDMDVFEDEDLDMFEEDEDILEEEDEEMSKEEVVSEPAPAVKAEKDITPKSKDRIIMSHDDEEDERTFEELGLCPALCEAVEALDWKKPSIIQLKTLPVAFSGRDIIGLAETGSGKTAAFALPVLQALLATPQTLFALVLAPTRELAFQISEQFEALGSGINLRCVSIVGGVDEMDQARALARHPHVIVATPGRIVYHLEKTKGFHLRNLKFFILDEADRLLNMDFEKEINKIIEVIPRNRRTFLFSATMTSKVAKLQRASLVNPVKIEVAKKYQTAKNLVQQYILCPAKFKEVYLTYILNELAGNTAIIFTSTCESTQRLAIMLRTLGFSAIPLHGKLSQQSRLAALAQFKAGKRTILLATDVASRGLDIPAVDLVINYDVPTHSKDYIHRVGRTARAGRSGRSITIITQYDVELYQRIEHLLETKLPAYECTREAVMVLNERVTDALRIASVELREEATKYLLHKQKKARK